MLNPSVRLRIGFWSGLLLWGLLLLLVAVAPAIAVDGSGYFAALETIRSADLQNHVNALADDAMEGRFAGSKGGRAAAEYLAAHLDQAGLTPAGVDGGFFQPFRLGCRNVLGIIEGSDDALKHEFILIGAHYDHVGYGNRRNSLGPIGHVHNGADDNASGVSGVLETLDALLALPRPPKRSVLVALWDGEEEGLWGSKHFVANPTVPLDKIALVVNVDMIGRLRDQQLMVYGTRTAAGLRRFVAEVNRDASLELDFDWELKPNSDHFPFCERRIPVLLFHTGLHEDMHRPSDDAHRINAEGMQQVARLIFSAVHEAAEREQLFAFRTAAREESPRDRKQLEKPLPPPLPRLGIRWQSESDPSGLVVAAVEPGTSADRSGLQAGDRLLRIDERPATDGTQLRHRVMAAQSRVSVVVERSGATDPVTLDVALDGKPARVGISWREDAAEPGTLLITRVVPGSPASLAGLQPGDRIYAIASQPIAGTEDFIRLSNSLPGPLELTVERRGRLRTIPLDVPEAFSLPGI